jgi:hypothetical protein
VGALFPPFYRKVNIMMRSRQRSPSGRVKVENQNSQKQITDNENIAETQSLNLDNTKILNEGLNSIDRSGNFDVDVQVDVHVDTTAIAFALLCSLLATKQMNNEEFEEAVRRLESLTHQGKNNDPLFGLNDPSSARIYPGNRKRVE